VQDALPIVIVAVVVVAGLVGVATVLLSRGAYDHIGRDGLTFDHEAHQADADTTTADAFRDEEIAQLLAANNARRAAQGRPLLELSDLQVAPDDALRAEVRAAVESRNARRVARGRSPLNVENEVERLLSAQDG
jgi:hypothetical protein